MRVIAGLGLVVAVLASCLIRIQPSAACAGIFSNAIPAISARYGFEATDRAEHCRALDE